MSLIRTFLVGVLGLAAPLLLVFVDPPDAHTYSAGAPAGFAGEETLGDGTPQACQACHASYDLNSGDGSVEVIAPALFTPGEPIEITVSVYNTTSPSENGLRQGFELTVQNADVEPVGRFDLGGSAAVQLADGEPAYVTHTAESNRDTSWTFSWVPPEEDAPEEVVIYAAGNATNGDNSPSNDYVYTTTATLSRVDVHAEDGPDAALSLAPVAPNPVQTQARSTLSLIQGGRVTLHVVDARGRTVQVLAAGEQSAGTHPVTLRAADLAPGVYALVAETPSGRTTRSFVVTR